MNKEKQFIVIKRFNCLTKRPTVYNIFANSELGAKHKAFMLFYGYDDFEEFDAIDRKSFKTFDVGSMATDQILE